jgi:hypothetical protein
MTNCGLGMKNLMKISTYIILVVVMVGWPLSVFENEIPTTFTGLKTVSQPEIIYPDDCKIRVRTFNYKKLSSLRLPNFDESLTGAIDTGQYDYLNDYAHLVGGNGKEQFYFFLIHFVRNPFFQKQRISFPLSVTVIDHRQKNQNHYFLESNEFKHKVLDNFTGLHWLPYNNTWNYEEKVSCVNFVRVTNQYIANYYFRLDTVWHLSNIKLEYPAGKIGTDQYGQENFEEFFWRFITDATFNRSRVQFPYLFDGTGIDSEITKIDTVSQEAWQPPFGHPETDPGIPYFGVYYNFDKSHPTSDTMNIRYAHNDNGINFGYVFICKKSKWFLISGWDHSN